MVSPVFYPQGLSGQSGLLPARPKWTYSPSHGCVQRSSQLFLKVHHPCYLMSVVLLPDVSPGLLPSCQSFCYLMSVVLLPDVSRFATWCQSFCNVISVVVLRNISRFATWYQSICYVISVVLLPEICRFGEVLAWLETSVSSVQFSSVQFSSRGYLCARKSA